MEQEVATQVVGLGGSTDFSLWQLFLRADFVVKKVAIKKNLLIHLVRQLVLLLLVPLELMCT
jgi:hypothetical protein